MCLPFPGTNGFDEALAASPALQAGASLVYTLVSKYIVAL